MPHIPSKSPGNLWTFLFLYIGHDTVGTEIIAAEADIYGSSKGILSLGRKIFHDFRTILQKFYLLLLGEHGFQKILCQLIDIVGTENQMHIGIFSLNGFHLILSCIIQPVIPMIKSLFL